MLQSGEPVAGAVVEFSGGPGAWVTKTYSAAQGKGATLDGSPISVSREADVGRSLLVCPLYPWTAPSTPESITTHMLAAASAAQPCKESCMRMDT